MKRYQTFLSTGLDAFVSVLFVLAEPLQLCGVSKGSVAELRKPWPQVNAEFCRYWTPAPTCVITPILHIDAQREMREQPAQLRGSGLGATRSQVRLYN